MVDSSVNKRDPATRAFFQELGRSAGGVDRLFLRPVAGGREALIRAATAPDAEVRPALTVALDLFELGVEAPNGDEWMVDDLEFGRLHATMWLGVARTLLGEPAAGATALLLAAAGWLEGRQSLPGAFGMAARCSGEGAEAAWLAGREDQAREGFKRAALLFAEADQPDRAALAAEYARASLPSRALPTSSFLLRRRSPVIELGVLSTSTAHDLVRRASPVAPSPPSPSDSPASSSHGSVVESGPQSFEDSAKVGAVGGDNGTVGRHITGALAESSGDSERRVRFVAGTVAAGAGDADLARSHFEAVAKGTDETAAEALLEWASVEWADDQVEESCALLRRAIAIGSDRVRVAALIEYAIYESALGHLDSASTAAEQLVAEHDAEASAIGLYFAGVLAAGRGDRDFARSRFDLMAASDDAESKALGLDGLAALADEDGDLDLAIRLARAAAEVPSSFHDLAMITVADLERRNGRATVARNIFVARQASADEEVAHAARVGLAVLDDVGGHIDSCVRLLKQVVDDDVESEASPLARLLLSAALAGNGEVDAGRQLLEPLAGSRRRVLARIACDVLAAMDRGGVGRADLSVARLADEISRQDRWSLY